MTGKTQPPGAAQVDSDLDELAKQLAPPEEQDQTTQDDARGGAIVVDTGRLRLPEGLSERQTWRTPLLGLEPVVVVLLTVVLAFIAFITWQIAHMPRPADEPPAQVQQKSRRADDE